LPQARELLFLGQMPKSKSNAKHNLSALAKAVRTHRHTTPVAADLNTKCLDVRTAAASPEFSLENLGLSASKRVPSKAENKTVLSGESSINVERRLRNASVPIGTAVDDVADISDDISLDGFCKPGEAKLLMPRRPAWSFELSSGRLHHREVQGFKTWLQDVQGLIAERGGYPPAYEQNLQVWRQLWRVLERCDVAVVVIDARHPLLHLPPALIYHVSRTLKKPLVVVFNKLDAVDPSEAKKWADCLLKSVPGIVGVVGFSKESVRQEDFYPLQIGRSALIETCHSVYASAATTPKRTREQDACSQPQENCDSQEGRIMLGLIGHPNVGKSSMINNIMGEKVVSVKATPGHTKILQTFILDDSTCLCDSPGVVFPRLDVPREAQIIGMLIPVAQVREPFSAIRWVMQHVNTPLNQLLNLKSVTVQQVTGWHEAGTEVLKQGSLSFEDGEEVPWSPMLICAQYASQRGLVRSGRPDCMAAGTEILERVLEGRIPYTVCTPTSPAEDVTHSSGGVRPPADEDDDSDWQVDDADYESGPEEAPLTGDTLLEAFGLDARAPGSGSKRSIRKQDRRKKLAAAAGDEQDTAVLPE